MLWAKAAAHHGPPIFWANCEPRGGYFLYIGRYIAPVQKQFSQLTIGVILVPQKSQLRLKHYDFSLLHHFPPVASGAVFVCKNNTIVLGRSGGLGCHVGW